MRTIRNSNSQSTYADVLYSLQTIGPHIGGLWCPPNFHACDFFLPMLSVWSVTQNTENISPQVENKKSVPQISLKWGMDGRRKQFGWLRKF